MIKRTLYFGSQVYLSTSLDQLIIDKPNTDKISVPIEDIGMIIFDHQQLSITQATLQRLLNNNASILWCDESHLPQGIVYPFQINQTFSEKLKYQLEASVPLKKQLWRQTIISKITNQSKILSEQNIPVMNMEYWAKSVCSGDSENHEARAAAYYWRNIFDENEGFTRGRYGSPPNHALNYGYAILRAIICRSLVASGCMPVLGIHHHNKYNAFCLADDIMEPYRPFVDRIVIELWKKYKIEFPKELSKEIKSELLKIPVIDVKIEDKTGPLMVQVQRSTSSLMDCFEGKSRKILYPEMQL